MFKLHRPARPSSADRLTGERRVGPNRSRLVLWLAAVAAMFVTAGAATLAYSEVDAAAVVAPRSAPSMDWSAPTSSLSPTTIPSPSPSTAPTVSMAVTQSPTPVASQPAPQRAPAKKPVAATRNRFSIPALHINGTIGNTSCGGLIPNGIWRWPCAGANNLYLLGHAYGVFAPVHNGYHAGSLKPGLAAIYTDGAGVAHRYRLLWVQDVPVATWGKGSSWAATSGPVITLQTCDGAADAYRIIVRFVPA